MFTIVSSKSEIGKLHLQFSKYLQKYATGKMTVFVGFKPTRLLLEVKYSEVLGIWWTFQEIGDKYWNSFGIGKPSEKHNNSITCEINYPLDGINTRLAGGIAKNEVGEAIIIHNGRIGGGKDGVGKKLFIDNYIGDTVEISLNSKMPEYVPVGSLNSERFAYQVALFVKEVARIKNLPQGEFHQASDTKLVKKLKTSFNREFSGKKNVIFKHSGVAFCDHGLVVNSFKELLQEKGAHVANNQLRDLYIIKDEKVITVFEFKTGFDRQSVYSAIGQLLLNNSILTPAPKYVIVLPVGLDEEIQNVVRSLDIEILQYKWKSNGKPEFLDMKKLII